ncbi:MAG: ATP-binding cassette domain-containing protein [Acidimicrobiaceae bacterium]|nr:ATP-binding cassette domain-containing protein [Acidimicrobiaceae bacterium]MYG99465.1 ATP-binding cassette domain-containing protein [Acidimicrobiaceae bacterium]MYL02876.1 ATP-binding cassette domain-containing protein [Acidimicrobiaceae bacterium]
MPRAARSGDQNSAIEARGLVRTFGDNRAVDGVDLNVDAGAIYGFLGPNGAGKSTTVRMLCTLLKPTAGQATVAGYDVVDSPGEVRIRIGVALQEAALDERQTGREILDLQARLYGLSATDRATSIARAVDLADIGGAMEDRVKTYSGGMRRRLDLAASLIHGPEVLFLDEPTTGLDPVSRAQVWDEVRRLNGELGVTVFLTTQYLEEADALADRVAIIDGGRIVEEGSPTELKRAVGADVIVVDLPSAAIASAAAVAETVPEVDAVTQGRRGITIATADGAATVGTVAVALSSAGLHPQSLTVRTPSLDDVFLLATGYRMSTVDPTVSGGGATATGPDPQHAGRTPASPPRSSP